MSLGSRIEFTHGNGHLSSLPFASGSLPWAIIGGLGEGVSALAVSRQWTNALVFGAVVAIIILAFGTAAIFMPGWYKGWL